MFTIFLSKTFPLVSGPLVPLWSCSTIILITASRKNLSILVVNIGLLTDGPFHPHISPQIQHFKKVSGLVRLVVGVAKDGISFSSEPHEWYNN